MGNDEGSSFAAHRSSLISRRVLLFGGKGGVGKTTVATAAALQFSRSRKVILFTTDPASNLTDLFDKRRPTTNLSIESLHAEQLYSNFLNENLANLLELGDRGTYLDKEELRRFFELSLPGVDEVMAWMRIGELAETNPSAIVIVDTAPTGHTLRMLGAGEHFRQFGAALESMQAKHHDIVRQLTRRAARDALDDYIEDFEARAQRRRELLTDPARAAFIPVLLSEPWVVEQTKQLIAAMEIDVPFAVLNRAVVDPDCDRDRMLMKQDAEARKALAPLEVVDAARACVPLDDARTIARWIDGKLPVPGSRLPGHSRRAKPATGNRQPVTVRRLTFLAGKGGVGKTTCAASIALQMAKTKRVTALSVDPAHTLREVFAGQRPPKNLAVEIIDTREKWRRFRDSLGEEIERAVGALAPKGMRIAHDSEAMRKLVEIAPPGADELFAITRLADLIADPAQESIVIDTAPTGHFLRLIDLPRSAGEWVKEFMRVLLRYRELIPPGSLGEELIRASRALHSVEGMLRSNDCGVLVVTRPERVVVAETKRLIDAVKEHGMTVSGVIANYVTPPSDCACDRSLRSCELEALKLLGPATLIQRRDSPPATLSELAALVPLQ